jgi:hypothetical protein
VTARLFTASWSSLWQASKRGPLPVQPVRISRGKPRFWPQAGAFPAVEELFVPGWVLSEKPEPARAEKAYRHQLDRIGLEGISARVDEIAHECGGLPLAVCCFEKAGEDTQCHRWWWARWWLEQTGLAVPEIGSPIIGDDLAIGQNIHATHATSGHLRPDALAQLSVDGEPGR